MPTRSKKGLSAGTTGGAGGLGIAKDVGGDRLRTGIINTASLTPPNPNPPSGSPSSLYSSNPPSTIESGDIASQGVDPGFSRGTHEHAVPAPAAPPQIDIGDAGDAGVATKLAREDHQHALPAPTAGYPADTDMTAEADGTATTVARADHRHHVTVPATGYPVDVAATEADGTDNAPARADHRHAHGTGYAGGHSDYPTAFPGFGTDPAQIDIGDAQQAGVSATASHSDHQHALLAPAAPTTSAFSDAAATGASAKVSREDHLHGRETNPVIAHEGASDPHTGYQKESEKDAASGYAGLNASSRTTKGVDTTDDVIIDLATKGLVLKDTQGTPHYWRLSVSVLGVLTTTDLGTVKP
jgi:hypothetical protein